MLARLSVKVYFLVIVRVGISLMLSNETLEQPSRATDCGQMQESKITKPQLRYRPGRAAEARGDPITGPPHQWERMSGDRDGRPRPAGQWEKRVVSRELDY